MSKRDSQLSQLASFADLPENWDSYEARRISPAAIEVARALLRAVPAAALVVPLPDGGIQIEWDRADGYCEIEIAVFPHVEEGEQ